MRSKLLSLLGLILPLIVKADAPFLYDFYKESNGVRLYYEYNTNSKGTVGVGVVGFEYYRTPETNTLEIPSSVEVWDNYYQKKIMFEVNCVSQLYNGDFKSVTLPPTLEKIDKLAFASCRRLQSITIPESVQEIGEDAFKECNELETVNFEAINCKNPAHKKSFFYECSSLKNVFIGDKVEYIHDHAFYNCSTIEYLSIGKSVAEIASWAFSGCTSIKDVYFNAIYCNTVETYSFYNSKNIEKVSFGSNVKRIPGNIFNGLNLLKEIKIPDNIIEIGEGAFKECSTITNITFGKSVKIIGPQAFASCSALESVDLKSAPIDSVGRCAFLDCYSLSKFQGSCVTADRRGIVLNGKLVAFAPAGIKDYVIPNEITVIGDRVFQDCKNITSINLPESISDIVKNPFRGCTSLSAFYGKFATKDNRCIIIDNCLKSFACSGLSEIVIPKEVTSIGMFAFCDCLEDVDRIILGSQVSIIGESAFFGYKDGLYVYLENENPSSIQVSNDIFLRLTELGQYSRNKEFCHLYVPRGSAHLYVKAPVWGEFGTIEEYDVEDIGTPNDNPNTDPDPGELSDVMFSIDGNTIYDYKTVDIPVGMKNDGAIIAFQCDVLLPEGLMCEKDEYGDYAVELSARADRTHVPNCNEIEDGMRLVVYSSKNIAFKGSEGALFSLPLKAIGDSDNYRLQIKNIYITREDRSEERCADVEGTLKVNRVMPGDANGDSRVTATDLTYIVDYLMQKDNPNFEFDGADANGDGKITVTDLTFVVDIIMNN